MSTEYAARMEVLQRRREDLTAQRQAIEKRIALREATAAEFSAVALQSCKQKWKAQRSAALAAMKRNQEFVRSLHEMQKQLHDNWVRLKSDQSSNNARLEQEKARYNRRIEQIYPAWQEQLQRQRVRKLRELEERKRAVDRRRYLAKKSFEKEQTLDDLIRKTRHEIEMAENLEQNELYERDLLRTQNTMQAKEVDQSIREVALEARSYLQQQASKNLETISNGDGSETFEAMTGQLRSGLTVTGSLEPILETSEQFSPDEVGGALQMRDPDIIGKVLQTKEPEAVPMPLHAGVLEPFSPVATGRVAHIKFMDEDVLLTSMQSDDFELSTNEFYQNTEMKPSVDSNEVAGGDIAPVRNDGPVLTATESRFTDPPGQEADTTISQSVTEKLTPPDRVKALGALIGRVEEGATEGDTFGRTGDARSSYESKRELLKMAVGGLKAQVAFYGSDICFELILEISRDLGPVLFPPKAFEGIMNDQKIPFLQRQSPPKPKKAFGIASSGRSFNDRPSGASDVFSSMGSGPMRLSQKLMRGGKMNDYSEFEEEEEVDLQNLIGTKPAFGSSSASAALGRSHYTANASSSKPSAKQEMAGEDDEFDADF
ncbi:hypothetical protein PHYBOEH_005367 [Phytophthora boehmeriae]|uniref:Uncharacterized protein n=1 Tax=Phytophthora boehmeriae TaxID=109152 RepID=A0A8T1WJS8_9STRA|nr:hypothetical protein PHYBOEH_005367 [Phytophthora boehmeriae]